MARMIDASCLGQGSWDFNYVWLWSGLSIIFSGPITAEIAIDGFGKGGVPSFPWMPTTIEESDPQRLVIETVCLRL